MDLVGWGVFFGIGICVVVEYFFGDFCLKFVVRVFGGFYQIEVLNWEVVGVEFEVVVQGFEFGFLDGCLQSVFVVGFVVCCFESGIDQESCIIGVYGIGSWDCIVGGFKGCDEFFVFWCVYVWSLV